MESRRRRLGAAGDHQGRRLRRCRCAGAVARRGAVSRRYRTTDERFARPGMSAPLAITMGDASGIGPEIVLRRFCEVGGDVGVQRPLGCRGRHDLDVGPRGSQPKDLFARHGVGTPAHDHRRAGDRRRRHVRARAQPGSEHRSEGAGRPGEQHVGFRQLACQVAQRDGIRYVAHGHRAASPQPGPQRVGIGQQRSPRQRVERAPDRLAVHQHLASYTCATHLRPPGQQHQPAARRGSTRRQLRRPVAAQRGVDLVRRPTRGGVVHAARAVAGSHHGRGPRPQIHHATAVRGATHAHGDRADHRREQSGHLERARPIIGRHQPLPHRPG